MTIGSIVGIIILGVFAGVLSSMVGIGGGIVIVPILMLAFGMSQHNAAGTTLAMLSFPVSLVAAYNYHKEGNVDWRIAMILCIGFIIGGYFGSKAALQIPASYIKKSFAILMIIIAVKFLFFERK